MTSHNQAKTRVDLDALEERFDLYLRNFRKLSHEDEDEMMAELQAAVAVLKRVEQEGCGARNEIIAMDGGDTGLDPNWVCGDCAWCALEGRLREVVQS